MAASRAELFQSETQSSRTRTYNKTQSQHQTCHSYPSGTSSTSSAHTSSDNVVSCNCVLMYLYNVRVVDHAPGLPVGGRRNNLKPTTNTGTRASWNIQCHYNCFFKGYPCDGKPCNTKHAQPLTCVQAQCEILMEGQRVS